MRVSDFTAFDGLDAAWKVIEVLADGQTGPNCPARHPAVMPDPIDRAYRALLVVLLRLAERGRGLGKLQLQQVLAMADPFQLGGELLRLAIRFRALAEAIDCAQQFRHVGARRHRRVCLYHNSVLVYRTCVRLSTRKPHAAISQRG